MVVRIRLKTTDYIKQVLIKNGAAGAVCNQVEGILNSRGLLAGFEEISLLKDAGMTNQLFLLKSGGNTWLLRLPGAGTANIINRQHEKTVYEALRGSSITDDLLFIDGENGIKISRYLEGYHVCDISEWQDVRSCMRKLRQFHELRIKVPHVFDVFAEIRIYEKECGVCIGRFPDCLKTREQVMSLRGLLSAGSERNCLCHIDSVYDNFLLNEKDVRLIDWEYAGMCDPYIDVAMFCIYAELEKEDTDRVIKEYLGEEDCPQARMKIYAYMSAGSYLWVLWSEIKWKSGVDFLEYEKGQYRLAKMYYQYAIELYRDR